MQSLAQTPPPPHTHHSSQCLLVRLVVVVPGMFGQKAVFCNYTELLFCALCIGEENRQVSACKIAPTAVLADIVASACSSPKRPQPCCRFRWRSLNAHCTHGSFCRFPGESSICWTSNQSGEPWAVPATLELRCLPCAHHSTCAKIRYAFLILSIACFLV